MTTISRAKKTFGTHAFKKALLKFNTEIKRALPRGNPHRFTISEAFKLYQRFNGRCVYCGLPLNVNAEAAVNSLNYKLYIPLEYNGVIDMDNVVIVCNTHADKYRPVKPPREDIPNVNTLADLIHVLIEETFKLEQMKNTEFHSLILEKIRRIKIELNKTMEDIAVNMRYKTYADWQTSYYEIIEEDKNTLADLVQEQTKKVASGEPQDVVDSTREKIVNQTKQMATSKQYRIIRNTEEK